MTKQSNFITQRRRSQSGLQPLILFALTLLLFGFSIQDSMAAGNGVSDCLIPEGLLGSPDGSYSADELQVGDTRYYWAYAQGFFQGYYPVSATCQDTGNYSYLITEDAYLNDIVSYPGSETLYVGTNSGVFLTTDGGDHWMSVSGGLPDVDGVFDDFDSTNYNRRAVVHSLFSRAEYGGSFDTLWVGTEFGPFWTTTAGDTMQLRASRINTDPEEDHKPATYDILGHPTEPDYLWCATQDGVYMTRNANRWIHISNGLPPSEEAAWIAAPEYALDYENEMLFTVGSKGIFYGSYRALGSSATADIIASWKPLGGGVTFAADTVNVDTLWLTVEPSTSQGLTITAGQTITLIDTTTNVYWSAFIDESVEGLWCEIDNDRIFYWPEGSSEPVYDYTDFSLDNVIAFGYSQISGRKLLAQSDAAETTIWIAAEDGGLYDYHLTGDIASYYDADSLTITSSHEDYMIYDFDIKDDVFYFATDQGLFKTSDPHGEWEQISGLISDRSETATRTIDAHAVAFGADNTIYFGSHLGGFLRSADGVTFEHSNLGLIHMNGTSEQLDIFLDQFENTTPAAANMGIYHLMQEWWGDLEGEDDVDGDPKLGILFLNIDDQYYLDTGDGSYISGYFDGGNEYLLSYSGNSNQMEMFYIDTDPGWINTANPAACRQMFNLINWNQDPAEEQWLRAGLMAFSQHVAGYPMMDSGTITFPMLNNLIGWTADAVSEDNEYLYSFLVVLYLYEQIFDAEENGPGIDHIADLATSQYRGIAGLGRLIYEKENGSSSADADYSYVFATIFHDFALAGALDITDPEFYDGKYGFEAVDVSVTAASRTWYYSISAPPPYIFQVPFWSVQSFQIVDTQFFNDDHPISVINFNGDDRNDLNFTLLFSDFDNFTPGMDPENVDIFPVNLEYGTNKAEIELPEELWLLGANDPDPGGAPNNMRIIATCTSDSGSQRTSYNFSDDITPPTNIWMTVAQNPIDEKYIDIYTFSNERIFPDGGQVYSVDTDGNTELEGPQIDLSGAQEEESGVDTLIVLDQDVFYSNPDASAYAYHIAYHLEDIQLPADLEFTAFGEDIAGNQQISAPLDISVDFILKDVGGVITHHQSDASLLIPGGALQDDALVLLSVSQYPLASPELIAIPTISASNDPQHYAVGPVVSAGSAGLELEKPVTITVPFNPDMVIGADIGVYRSESGGWIYIGSNVDLDRGLVTAQSDKFGSFRAFAGPLGDISAVTPHKFRMAQNYPNPFNPTTSISFELTKSQHIKLDVFNITGQLIGTIDNGQFNAGWHTVRWEPQQLSSGVYFLRLEAEEGTLYQKMMLLK
ncbi:T9SS type A sorting domain-containing protein [bacterium]|nr:T9SS type A sorting domain-containing protein [bacterium]